MNRAAHASQVEVHEFCPGAPLLIRGDISIGRFNYNMLAEALAPFGLAGELKPEGFVITPLSGTSAVTQ